MPEDINNPKMGGSTNLLDDFYFGTVEKTQWESGNVGFTQFGPYNPSDFYQKRSDYSVPQQMMSDSQVYAAMQLKIDLIIGNGWKLVTQDENQEEVTEEMMLYLDSWMEEPLDLMIEDMVKNSYQFGFSITEKVFKLRDNNYLMIDKLKTTHPGSWTLHTDKLGNVVRFEQTGIDGDRDINPNSLIHFKNNPQWQNPYGTSDLESVFAEWFSKRQVLRYYSIFMEKYASPTPVGKYKTGTPNARITDFFNVLKKFQAKTAIVHPDAMELEFLETKSNGEVYQKALNHFNMAIGRGLLVPDLLGFTGSESQAGGSQALGREQMDVFFKHLERRRQQIERAINRHVIQPMLFWNYGQMPNPPKFKFNPIAEDDLQWRVTSFLESVKAGKWTVSDEEVNHFRESIQFPTGDVERPMGGQGDPNGPFSDNPFNDPSGDIPASDNPNLSPDEVEAQFPVGSDDQNAPEKKEETKKKENAAFKQVDGDFHKRTDFKALSNQLESNEKTLIAEFKPLMDEIYEDLYDQIQKKKILVDPAKPERINTLKLKKLKQLQLLLKKHFRAADKQARMVAHSEIRKSDFGAKLPKTYAEPLPSDEFLEFLETETFDFIGSPEKEKGWAFKTLDNAKIELRAAVKDGRSLSSVIGVLDDRGKELSTISMERFARTKFTEVMNRGRQAEFESLEVNGENLISGYQYSAILDGRTSRICEGLHGKLFKRGEEPIPPMHFNCRSLLIPITMFEDFDPDTKVGKTNINTFIEDEQEDTGFSKR